MVRGMSLCTVYGIFTLVENGGCGPTNLRSDPSSNQPAEAAETITLKPLRHLSDFNEHLSERTELLRSFIQDEPVTPTWACCQLADTECLKTLIKMAEMNPFPTHVIYSSSVSLAKRTQKARGSASRLQTEAFTNTSSGRSKKVKLNVDGERFVPRSKVARDLPYGDKRRRPIGGASIVKGLDSCWNQRLVYGKGDLPRDIRSEDTFTLTTDDPVKKPLPSWKLLEMQWILQKILAMSGPQLRQAS
ncbi:hypothetical protein V8E54_000381 [Elaphomyces granulatus]